MDQRPITTCLMKRIGKRSQRGRFSRADFRADYLRLEYYWNQYQGVVLLLGTKPSRDPVLKWPECDQNGAIGPLGDNKGHVDTWAQKWDENGPKNRGKNRPATIGCLNGAKSWCQRIYNEDPRHLHHINHPLEPLRSLCFSVSKGKMRRPLFFLFAGIKDLHDRHNCHNS